MINIRRIISDIFKRKNKCFDKNYPLFFIIFCRYQTVANGTLRINSVQEGDEGSYQCVVRNDGDSAQATGSLLLGGNAILYHYLDLIEISRLFNNNRL